MRVKDGQPGMTFAGSLMAVAELGLYGGLLLVSTGLGFTLVDYAQGAWHEYELGLKKRACVAN